MKEEIFNELLESVRQGGEILRGERPPSRVFEVEIPDVKAIRERYDVSQIRFAAMIGVPVATLRNWEQGRRKPGGTALTLLRLAALDPKIIETIATFSPIAMGNGTVKGRRRRRFSISEAE